MYLYSDKYEFLKLTQTNWRGVYVVDIETVSCQDLRKLY